MAHDRVWMEDAACLDVDLLIFFPKRHKQGVALDTSKAESICEECPVQKTCLAFALAHDVPYGVWGGWDWPRRRDLDPKVKIRVKRAWFRLHPVRPLSHSIGAYGKTHAASDAS